MQASSPLDASSMVIRKGHICPPSNATHPADRWETAFVYSFICKFTKLKQDVDGLVTVEDLEEALLFNGPNPILEQILARLMLYLRPQTRNTKPEMISGTVAAYFTEVFARGERTNFWDENLNGNIDPFVEGEFFQLSWDKKLRILRQLVEWVLCYSTEIKGTLDRAWGIVHFKHKKSNVEIAQEAQMLPDDDPFSRTSLVTIPLGQDAKKKRYWALDASPRLYVSTNPWKVTATFTRIASTKEEYLKVIEDLKENCPAPIKEGEKRPKSEVAHFTLITTLEGRIEAVDTELQRIARVRKKFLQKQAATAQVAELNLRGTRTRRSAQKADYVYYDGDGQEEEEEDFIDDTYEDRGVEDEADFINDDPITDEEDYGGGRSRRPRRAAAMAGTERRRSTRTSVTNSNGSRNQEWRGERRSTRLGAAQTSDLPPPAKRPRVVESATPSSHEDQMEVDGEPPKPAALRPTEIALPAVPGKKKSKFWFYAVEPNASGTATPTEPGPSGSLNGNANGNGTMEISSKEEIKMEAKEESTIDNGPISGSQPMKMEQQELSVQ